jgi:hypothetical protein
MPSRLVSVLSEVVDCRFFTWDGIFSEYDGDGGREYLGGVGVGIRNRGDNTSFCSVGGVCGGLRLIDGEP